MRRATNIPAATAHVPGDDGVGCPLAEFEGDTQRRVSFLTERARPVLISIVGAYWMMTFEEVPQRHPSSRRTTSSPEEDLTQLQPDCADGGTRG